MSREGRKSFRSSHIRLAFGRLNVPAATLPRNLFVISGLEDYPKPISFNGAPRALVVKAPYYGAAASQSAKFVVENSERDQQLFLAPFLFR